MVARSFFLPCSAALLLAASLFSACATGADFADDDDGPADGAVDGTVVAEGGKTSSSSSSGAASSSSGGSSGAGSSSSSGSSAECKLTINEVSADTSDWVELFNPSGCDDVSLSGYALVYQSATGTSDTPLFDGASDSVAGGAYFVIGAGGDAPFTGGTSPLGAAGGKLALKDGSSSVDEVAYGSANASGFGEGDPAPATGSDSIQRIPDGTDTDDNAADFQVSAPTKGEANE